MEVTREVFKVDIDDRFRCSFCGEPMWYGTYGVSAYADGDYYKQLYLVCSLECEYKIEEEDE